MSNRTTRLIGLYAVVSAAAICVVAPLLSLAYFATKDGAYALETSTTSAWADPARRLADGLLTFAAPERVYGTYLQAFALIFPAVLLCAVVVRSTRPAQKPRAERWGWRIALLGYGLLTGGLAVAFCMESVSVLTGTTSHNGPLNVLFLAALFPGILFATLGSTILGISLIRSSYETRVTAWLLALSLPLWALGSFVLGHNSLGLAPLFIAWGVTGLHLWRTDPSPFPEPAANPASMSL